MKLLATFLTALTLTSACVPSAATAYNFEPSPTDPTQENQERHSSSNFTQEEFWRCVAYHTARGYSQAEAVSICNIVYASIDHCPDTEDPEYCEWVNSRYSMNVNPRHRGTGRRAILAFYQGQPSHPNGIQGMNGGTPAKEVPNDSHRQRFRDYQEHNRRVVAYNECMAQQSPVLGRNRANQLCKWYL